MGIDTPTVPPEFWSWAWSTIGACFLAVVYCFARRTWLRHGKTLIQVGDREPCQYITRGQWSADYKAIVQSAPRFMEFRIHLTIENRRGVPLTINVRSVSFSDGRPVVDSKEWDYELPGSCIHNVGFRIENAAGAINDPIIIEPHGIVRVRIIGTATTPVCHAGPYQSWRYVFIDWNAAPVEVPRFIQEVAWEDGVRLLDPDLEPTFPIPKHYFQMQGGKVP